MESFYRAWCRERRERKSFSFFFFFSNSCSGTRKIFYIYIWWKNTHTTFPLAQVSLEFRQRHEKSEERKKISFFVELTYVNKFLYSNPVAKSKIPLQEQERAFLTTSIPSRDYKNVFQDDFTMEFRLGLASMHFFFVFYFLCDPFFDVVQCFKLFLQSLPCSRMRWWRKTTKNIHKNEDWRSERNIKYLQIYHIICHHCCAPLFVPNQYQ